MTVKSFVDTNVLIYSVSNEPLKREKARELLLSDMQFVISTQVLAEFYSAASGKMGIPAERGS
jgi:predicted nucleic acid-binding protein